jgi:hypothetical protein
VVLRKDLPQRHPEHGTAEYAGEHNRARFDRTHDFAPRRSPRGGRIPLSCTNRFSSSGLDLGRSTAIVSLSYFHRGLSGTSLTAWQSIGFKKWAFTIIAVTIVRPGPKHPSWSTRSLKSFAMAAETGLGLGWTVLRATGADNRNALFEVQYRQLRRREVLRRMRYTIQP